MASTTNDPIVFDPNEPGLTPAQQLNRIRYTRALNRRNFMAGLGAAGAVVAGGSLLAGCGSSKKTIAAGPSETDVLNFALNLEYLEANFYTFATTGAAFTPATPASGTAGAVMGGAMTVFTDPELANIAKEITVDEQDHVNYLLKALGSMAVAQPAINLAALGPYATDATFLNLARAFEDTGVSAYAGAATLLTGNNLQAAAQILATEAYHAGNIRLKTIQAAVTPITTLDSQDVPPAAPNHYFTVDSNALAIKRTTSQVLMIVYANTTAGATSGGFFPSGVNGNIKST